MPIELYIGDDLLDLEPGETIAVTRQINDIADVGKIKADGSNQFKLPKTANNRRILENAGEVTSLTNIPYRLNSAKVVQDGIELLSNANAVIESTDQYYNVQVVSGNKNFFDLIDGLKLTDLDLDDLTHQWVKDVALDSRFHTSGYIYPIIDNGYLNNYQINPLHLFDIRYQQPAVFIHTLWNRISEAQGYTWSGDFIDSSFFKSLLLFYNTGKPTPVTDESANNAGFEVKFPLGQEVYNHNLIGLSDIISFDTVVNDPYGIFNTSNQKFSPFYSGTYTFFFSFDAAPYPDTSDFVSKHTRLYLNDTLVINIEEDETQTHTERIFEIELEHGDYFRMAVEVGGIGTITNAQLKCLNISGATSKYSGHLDGTNLVPPMSQKDFIKGIANMFGLIFQPDKYTNTIKVKRFNQIKENIDIALDWSDKLDIGKQHKIEYRLGNFAQNNYFLYTEDTSNPAWVEGIGDGSFTIDDENLQLKADIVKLPFSGTPSVKKFNNRNIPNITIFEEEEDSAAYVMKYGAKPRVLVLDKQNLTSEQIRYSDTGGLYSSYVNDSIPFCYFIEAGKPHNLGFNDNLLNKYYDALQDTLDHAKKVNAYFKLTQNDIAELDHFTPIYVEYFGHHFYVNKVNNFVQGKSTKCELIRL